MIRIQKNNPKLARNLEQKLIDGDKYYILSFAIECKHKINKKISKYGLFRTANDIFVYTLAHIEAKFKATIKGRIQSKDFKPYQIDLMIEEEIIETLWCDCQYSTLFDDISYLHGLLYLLTGNCHIDWDVEI